MLQHGPECCDCWRNGVVGPGEPHLIPWDGKAYAREVFPSACLPKPSSSPNEPSCFRGVVVPPGPVDIVIHLYTTEGGYYLPPTDAYDVFTTIDVGSASAFEVPVQ